MTDDSSQTAVAATPTEVGERADLLAALAGARFFLRHPSRGLDDAQAALTPTAGVLSVGGLYKHLARIERRWTAFMTGDPDAVGPGAGEASDYAEHEASFRMLPGETLAELLADYEKAAAATDAVLATIDLDSSNPLPPAPWFPPGARWSARRVALHLVAETAQHAGHADIIRETIDGAKSMG